MHHSDDEEQREVEQLHAAVFPFERIQRKNGVVEPNEQAKEDDSQPVNIVSSHAFFPKIMLYNSINQQINSNQFQGVIRLPIQFRKTVGRGRSGSVCSLSL